jgi:uncharacterized protein (TIGR02246 family)
MESDEQQIRRLMAEWHERTKRGDVEAILALMTDDAVFLTCGNPPMTKRDFAESFRKFAGRIQIESTQEIRDFHVSGDVAYSWSHVSVVMTSPETGERSERAGHVLTVFRKSPLGSWLLARDANLMSSHQAR